MLKRVNHVAINLVSLTMIRKELAEGVKVIILGISISNSEEFLLKFVDPSRMDLKKLVTSISCKVLFVFHPV